MSSPVSKEDVASQAESQTEHSGARLSPRELKRRKVKLALILAAVAISLYVLSIVSIISSRGGVV